MKMQGLNGIAMNKKGISKILIAVIIIVVIVVAG
jgi:hypothetical protein